MINRRRLMLNSGGRGEWKTLPDTEIGDEVIALRYKPNYLTDSKGVTKPTKTIYGTKLGDSIGIDTWMRVNGSTGKTIIWHGYRMYEPNDANDAVWLYIRSSYINDYDWAATSDTYPEYVEDDGYVYIYLDGRENYFNGGLSYNYDYSKKYWSKSIRILSQKTTPVYINSYTIYIEGTLVQKYNSSVKGYFNTNKLQLLVVR